ncbi:MAG: hypothetical protein GTO18_13065 [Anaerolineales bacterium]|nr:hypothetical protein [Anaerolineales bacterium]
MASVTQPLSQLKITISKAQARRFLLTYHGLLPPRKFTGKQGIMEYIRRVGCIQFDPINVVGQNPDLVLQSRVLNYQPQLLEEMLYADRELLNGYDKVASIYPAVDWPNFARRRAAARDRFNDPEDSAVRAAPEVLEALREHGPQSSIDLKNQEKIHWSWGHTASLAKASLDVLFAWGEVLVHHKVGTRRVFDLTERILPEEVIRTPDPNVTSKDYRDWHVLRRVGGLGLANPSAAEYWLGILDLNGSERRHTLLNLVERGDLQAAGVEGIPNKTFYLRSIDLPALEGVRQWNSFPRHAAILGPLDNVLWDRNLIRWIFDFDYTWEVYKPVAERVYGYYVLPVIYGDKFVARFEPIFDRKTRSLHIKNWWWEPGIRISETMLKALVICLRAFKKYLGAGDIFLSERLSGDSKFEWMNRIVRG